MEVFDHLILSCCYSINCTGKPLSYSRNNYFAVFCEIGSLSGLRLVCVRVIIKIFVAPCISECHRVNRTAASE